MFPTTHDARRLTAPQSQTTYVLAAGTILGPCVSLLLRRICLVRVADFSLVAQHEGAVVEVRHSGVLQTPVSMRELAGSSGNAGSADSSGRANESSPAPNGLEFGTPGIRIPYRSLIFAKLPQEHSRNRSRDQVGHGTGQHGAHSQPCKVIAPLRNQCAYAADLHPDGTEVGKPA